MLDFNFAYNPSCSYDPRWVCPLAPPANRLHVAVRAGERFRFARGGYIQVDILALVDAATTLREARHRAGLTQAALASRTGTSQATISAYESGRKQPCLETFSRLLAATGSRLSVEPGRPSVVEPSARQRARTARSLLEVLALAEALPTRHERELRFPPLPSLSGRAA